MNKIYLCSGIRTCRAYAANVLFVTFIAVSGASFAAPPNGNSVGGQTMLSDLGCATGEVARVTDVEEWDCSPGLTVVEGQAASLDGRVTTLETQNLDGRLSTIEGQNLDSRVSTVEGQADNLDLRITVIEQENIPQQLYGLESRISTLEDIQSNLGPGVNLAGQLLYLSDMETHFSHVNLTGANLANTSWIYDNGISNLVATNMRGANLSGVIKTQGIFYIIASNLRSTNFTESELTAVIFKCSDLSGANFSGAFLYATGFETENNSECTTTFTNLSGANFTEVTFKNSSFSGFGNDPVRLKSSNLTDAVFIQTGGRGNVTAASFSFAKLVGTDFSNEGRGFLIQYTSFDHADLREANLTNAHLSHVDFTKANLDSANLSGATFDYVTWNDTICPDGSNSDNNGATCEGYF